MSDEQNVPNTQPVTKSEEQEPITTADGAVRHLEKAAIAEQAGSSGEGGGEVRSFGKARGGAPEEDSADSSDVHQSGIPQQP